jgi:hypothetical protein
MARQFLARSMSVSVFALIGLASCVTPTFEPEPYPEEVRARIVPGQSSRDEVRAILGAPQATRGTGRYWLYGRTRTTANINVITSILASGPETEANWIFLEFGTDDLVIAKEHLEDANGCTKYNHMCLMAGWINCDPAFKEQRKYCENLWLRDDVVIITAPEAMDQAMRSALPAMDQCTVRFTVKLSMQLFVPFALVTDGTSRAPANPRTFDVLTLPPGEHVFGVSQGDHLSKVSVARSCAAGDVINLRFESNAIWGSGGLLRELSTAEFLVDMADRRLVMPR